MSSARGSSCRSRGSTPSRPFCRRLESVLGSNLIYSAASSVVCLRKFLLMGHFLSSICGKELWIKVSPSQSCLFRIGHVLLGCNLLLLSGRSRRGTVCSLRTSCSPFSLILLGGVLPLPSIGSSWQLVPCLEDFSALPPEWVTLQTYHFYHGLGLVEGIDKFFCINLRANLVLHVLSGLGVADSVRIVDGRDCRKAWSLRQCRIENLNHVLEDVEVNGLDQSHNSICFGLVVRC